MNICNNIERISDAVLDFFSFSKLKHMGGLFLKSHYLCFKAIGFIDFILK